MKNEKIEKALSVASDMQNFGPIPDELTKLIRECEEERELSVEEMDLVSAASSAPGKSFEDFMKLIKKD